MTTSAAPTQSKDRARLADWCELPLPLTPPAAQRNGRRHHSARGPRCAIVSVGLFSLANPSVWLSGCRAQVKGDIFQFAHIDVGRLGRGLGKIPAVETTATEKLAAFEPPIPAQKVLLPQPPQAPQRTRAGAKAAKARQQCTAERVLMAEAEWIASVPIDPGVPFIATGPIARAMTAR